VAVAAFLCAFLGLIVFAAPLAPRTDSEARSKLRALLDETWEFELREDPLFATMVGDHRFDDTLPSVRVSDHARRAEARRKFRERLLAIDPAGLVLHSDNGKPMRGSTMLATLQWLGVVPSFSRPHVSNDNPYSEALFRTLKHAAAYPKLPFADGAVARRWVERFVAWYNAEHRHSGIRYVTPDERHWGREAAILARRHALYTSARRCGRARWLMESRPRWLVSTGAVRGPRASA